MQASQARNEVISLAKAANKSRADEASTGDTPAVSTLTAATAEERRLESYLQALPPAMIYLLTAAMYLGRGDFDSKEEFLNYYADVTETFGEPKAAVRLMMAKEPLPAYLEKGWEKLQKLGLDLNKLPN